eukprot:9468842-Alexandrium_andersonii.AAC.1
MLGNAPKLGSGKRQARKERGRGPRSRRWRGALAGSQGQGLAWALAPAASPSAATRGLRSARAGFASPERGHLRLSSLPERGPCLLYTSPSPRD